MEEHDHGAAGTARLVLVRHGEGKVNVDGVIGIASRHCCKSEVA